MKFYLVFLFLIFCLWGCGGDNSEGNAIEETNFDFQAEHEVKTYNSKIEVNKGEGANFRTVKWNMTMSEVKFCEKDLNLLDEGSDSLTYLCHNFNRETKLFYSFENDKLIQGAYANVGKNIGELLVLYYEMLKDRFGEYDEISNKRNQGGVLRMTWFTADTTIDLISPSEDGSIPFSMLVFAEKEYELKMRKGR